MNKKVILLVFFKLISKCLLVLGYRLDFMIEALKFKLQIPSTELLVMSQKF